MTRRTITVCEVPGCPNLTPCELHKRKPWAGSLRRDRIGRSGWAQQASARRVMRKHKSVCHVCGRAGSTEVDHVIPVAEGGSDNDENKAPIHTTCHREKTAIEAARGRQRR